MFLNLSALSNVCLSIPVATASVEQSFSQMKLIKTMLRNRIGEKSLSYLMKIAIESPAKLTNEDLENIIDIWQRQPRRIIVYILHIKYHYRLVVLPYFYLHRLKSFHVITQLGVVKSLVV